MEKYGKLTLIGPTTKRQSGHVVYSFRCDCGNIWTGRKAAVVTGAVISCGCVRAATQRKRAKKQGFAKLAYKHGLSKDPLYKTWHDMIRRCTDKTDKKYKDYGGRGIRVCRLWSVRRDYAGLKSFVAWAKKNGYRAGLRLDRERNNGPYSPANCRFITNQQNQLNKRNNINLTFNGITMTQVQWAAALGVTYQCVYRWRRDGVWEEKFSNYLNGQ